MSIALVKDAFKAVAAGIPDGTARLEVARQSAQNQTGKDFSSQVIETMERNFRQSYGQNLSAKQGITNEGPKEGPKEESRFKLGNR